MIPIFSVGITRRYHELEGKHLLNDGFSGLPITLAQQLIRFRLDENGARLESTSEFAVGAFAIPKRMVFDKPFLIYLREIKSERPYFAAWIETPELLEKMR